MERREKLQFFGAIDLLSVPTAYQEPKGLFVLEAWASGLPVVQPAHGAFPELLAGVDGGRLVRPGDVGHLADALAELLSDGPLRRRLGANGQQAVRSRFTAEQAATATLEVYRRVLGRQVHAAPADSAFDVQPAI